VNSNQNLPCRVVVTGVGIVSPLGITTEETWQGLISGKSGIGSITQFDATNYATKFAGEVKSFDPVQYIDRKAARHMDRFTHLAVVAAKQALADAKLRITPENRNDIGCVVGSGIGGLQTMYEQTKVLLERGPDRVSPFFVPMMAPNMASAQISILEGARGPNFCTSSACSSSADAVGAAFQMVRYGDAQVMITGGSEALITPLVVAAFNSNKALSTRNNDPQTASRPFDAERDGFVLAEGAGILILENRDFALARGANILAEMVGYGATGDSYHITAPAEDGEGATRAMLIALKKSGLTPADVDYINAHGTSTSLNDKIETMAIKAALGESARRVAISSTKSMMGHLLGGAGAVEAAISVLVIKNGIIPPTINYTHADPDCDLDYVPNVARKANVKVALSNSFGFGGHNSVLAFKKYTES
jgi:3-oxoacyl-[acyl-carrier-protein] synthase II